MHLLFVILLSLSAALFSGCAGTIATRCNKGAAFGAYPYTAIVKDGRLVGAAFNHEIEKTGNGYMPVPMAKTVCLFLGIFSMPLDLAVDTICIPVDLICWPIGYRKDN